MESSIVLDKRPRAGDALSAIHGANGNGHSTPAKDAVEKTTTVAKGKGKREAVKA